MRKRYLINLNPEENPRQGYLLLGFFYNPFPSVAICVGSPGPVRSQWVVEMEVTRHLKDGVSLEQARGLLQKNNILTEEATTFALHKAKEGDRLEVIVDSNKMAVYQRKITSKELARLRAS